jgi:hypothetical protein
VSNYSGVEKVTIAGKGYEVEYNAVTQLGELRAGTTVVVLNEDQVGLLVGVAEGDRDKLVRDTIAAHARFLEARSRTAARR